MTSTGNREIEQVRQARKNLERMHGRLLQPSFSSLESSGVDLKHAMECLRQLDISLQSPIWQPPVRQKIETEVVALRSAVRSVQLLLKNAGKIYAGVARLMTPDEAPPNYTALGTSGQGLEATAVSVLVHG
jgi:hypothetical protein